MSDDVSKSSGKSRRYFNPQKPERPAPQMTPEVEAVIEEFALAHMDAHKNPRCMLDAKGAEECTRVTLECVTRMGRITKADGVLFDFWAKGRFEELPEPAKDFILAELDRGCPSCWLSSSCDPHPEHGDVCFYKIAHWFKCRTKLIRFGAENLLNRSAE